MRVLYDAAFTQTARDAPVSMVLNDTSKPVPRSGEVTGFALIDTTMTSITVEGSDDDFASTVFSQVVSDVVDTALVAISSTTAAKWRVKAGAAGTFGTLYPGTLVTVDSPVKPFAFEDTVFADDRESLGGVGYSKVHHTARAGPLSFEGVPNGQLPSWRAWYGATSGFRRGFVIEEPLNLSIHLVRAPGAFPLVLMRGTRWAGAMAVKAVQ